MMFRYFIKNCFNQTRLIRQDQLIRTYYSNNNLSDNLKDKLEMIYWVGAIPSGIACGIYGTNMIVKKNIDSKKDNFELFIVSATFGLASGIAGIGIWLSLPLTGPIILGSYIYNKYYDKKT